MFTGIIDHTGTIIAILKTTHGLRFTLTTQFNDLQLGESIAIDGVCLTVTDFSKNSFSCDISPETLKLTTFGQYYEGSSVNLERSLRLGDRLGGHYVTGHVDRTAYVKNLIPHDTYFEMQISGFEQSEVPLLSTKGSLTINGVSLTINSINTTPSPEACFMLIPHTLNITNLKNVTINDLVNIEFDYYAKTIAHQLSHYLNHQEITHVL